MPDLPRVNVALALINQQGKTLLGVRGRSAHAGGLFEFIGGKVASAESAREALVRECHEELGIEISQIKSAFTLVFDYPDRSITLYGFWVESWRGNPKPLGTESLHWITLSELDQLPMPAANDPIKQVAKLPKTYLITTDLKLKKTTITAENQNLADTAVAIDELDQALQSWLQDRLTLPLKSLVYVRLKGLAIPAYIELFTQLAKARADLQLVCEYRAYQQLGSLTFGAHLTSQDLMSIDVLPKSAKTNLLWFASVHDEDQIMQANQLGVHAVTLSPVQPTTSHPEAVALGWEQAAQLADRCRGTVYALGGMNHSDLDQLSGTNFYGVSGISHFN